ncbi:MAG: cation:proton antiporter [Methanomassiliicoccales archaeon]|nr:MAG: cation:proton antiporter [Methanomassiliicoccales archaeon]
MSEESRIIVDMTLLMLISGICSLVFARIKMPPILGYLAAGLILGPTMFPDLWVEEATVVILSNIGIVLLMFWIGLEQSAAKLKRTGSVLIIIVTMEMTLMVVVGYLVGLALGMPNTQAIFFGAIISGTSTAVVVSVLKENGAIDGAQASMIIGITVFEDVGQVIILTMAAPLLAGDSPALGSTVNMVIGLAIFFGLTIMVGIAIVPRVLDAIGNTYSMEILFVLSVGLCFTMALISSSLGLSIAIGAFLMGLIVSKSVHSDDLMSKVAPIKELFMAVFFISIGLQIDPSLIWDNVWLVMVIAITFILAKTFSVILSCYVMNVPSRSSFMIATSLVAMGEFAFIIAKIALDEGVVTREFYSAMVGAALVTMIVLPVLTKAQVRMFNGFVRSLPRGVRSALGRIEEIRATASARFAVSKDVREKMRRGLLLIFLDYLIIVLLLLLFSMLNEVKNAIGIIAEELHVVPDLLVLFLMVLSILPAIVNIYGHIRNLSELLTSAVMSSRRFVEGSRKNVFAIFANLGKISMVTLVLLLLIPFLPNIGPENPMLVIVVVMMALTVAYLAWGTLKNGYDRFYIMVAQNAPLEQGGDEE